MSERVSMIIDFVIHFRPSIHHLYYPVYCPAHRKYVNSMHTELMEWKWKWAWKRMKENFVRHTMNERGECVYTFYAIDQNSSCHCVRVLWSINKQFYTKLTSEMKEERGRDSLSNMSPMNMRQTIEWPIWISIHNYFNEWIETNGDKMAGQNDHSHTHVTARHPQYFSQKLKSFSGRVAWLIIRSNHILFHSIKHFLTKKTPSTLLHTASKSRIFEFLGWVYWTTNRKIDESWVLFIICELFEIGNLMHRAVFA